MSSTEVVSVQPPDASTVPAAIEIPPVNESVNESDNSVRNERSILGWHGYTPAQLHSIVINAMDNLRILTKKGRTEVQERLLPALTEIKSRLRTGEEVAGHTSIKDYLEAVGLTDSIVRGWEFRLREKELKQLIGSADPDPATIEVPHTVSEPVEPTRVHTYPQENYAPDEQVKAAGSRSHGMGLERLRKLAEGLKDCTVSHDGDTFCVRIRFESESKTRAFLERL